MVAQKLAAQKAHPRQLIKLLSWMRVSTEINLCSAMSDLCGRYYVCTVAYLVGCLAVNSHTKFQNENMFHIILNNFDFLTPDPPFRK